MVQVQERAKPCFNWQQTQRCKFGNNCRFAHGVSDSRPLPILNPFQEWRLRFPRPGAKPRPTDLAKLSQDGLAMVSTGSCAVMQDTILTLASDPGLLRIRELLSLTLDPRQDDILMQQQVLPFFSTILHSNVQASPLLENEIVKIYNFIYGPYGQRSVDLFSPIVTLSMQFDKSQKERKTQFGTVLEVFTEVMLRNGAAHVNTQLVEIAKSFLDQTLEFCNHLGEVETLNLRRFFEKLNRHLKLGKEIPYLDSRRNNTPNSKAKFVQEQQPPGGRHDNDHVDIRKIQIMPTYNEIACLQQEYLPIQEQGVEGLCGLEALVDRHFRLLREDTVGQLRDAVRVSLQTSPTNGNRNQKHVNGARTYTYSNLRIIDICFLRGSGIEMFVQVDQPVPNQNSARRKEWWTRTKRLQVDALVCIANFGASHVYCTVSAQGRPTQRQHSKSKPPEHEAQTERLHKYDHFNLHNQRESAYLTLKPVDTSSDALAPLFVHLDGTVDAKLVEFPGVLLPAFQPTLLALQHILSTQDMPFAGLLTALGKENIKLDLPAYARAPDFSYDLGSLTHTKDALLFSPHKQFDAKMLVTRSTLDEPQAKALLHCLTTSLSLIQGPPGTGKSFTGVALIKVLLAIKQKAKLGPIVCVCYTNHALDQLLENLHKDGVKQIVRVGSRSKSEVLEAVNLRTIANSTEQTPAEKRSKWELHQKLDDDTTQASQLLDKLSKAHFVRHVREYLREHNVRHYFQLFGQQQTDGWQVAGSKKADPLKAWVGKVPQNPGASRPLHELEGVDLDDTTPAERRSLLQSWVTEIRETASDDVLTITQSYESTNRQFEAVRGGIDLRCLEDANVVGLTTTGLARNLDMLRKLRAKVLVCEEAGEVLEAHVLTALLPKLEHVVLIGDHQQLRPQVQNYELSRENPRGEKYSLDVSLFERLVHDPNGLQSQIPYCTLGIQRRMHPSISQLIRNTLYPALQDAPNVAEYPEIVGMKQRLFWFDHNHLEDNSDEEQIGSTSHSNSFEITMVTALVLHLVRQGIYQPGEIAVLTPYLAQLFKLRAALSKVMTVAVGERDLEQAERQGLQVEDEQDIAKEPDKTTKTSLLQAMRVATIDNFQGEEAKVVVISLVRSNEQNRVGFLRTSNRINVLLSRAQHGMYIFGNSTTASTVPMWRDVFRMLKTADRIGPKLELQCARHPHTSIPVSVAEDFVVMSPEGGCGMLCDRRLLCGHPCRNKCHSNLLHNAVHCLEPCPRSLQGCDHSCPQDCGDPCVKRCGVVLKDQVVPLSCGHLLADPSCWQKQFPEMVACTELVDKVVPGCEHTVRVKCCTNVDAPDYKCCAPCKTHLTCGHECKQLCYQCQPSVEGREQSITKHAKCQQVCGRQYNSCSHSCQEICHDGVQCPPCGRECDIACIHSRCDKKCNEPCAPCAHDVCQSQCPHSQCTMPCAAPCNWIPCGEGCPKLLECGHQCPSLCGEICPSSKFCQICATEDIKEQIVDMIEMKSYAEIKVDEEPCIIPPCGHILTVTTMDGMIGMSEYYRDDAEGKIVGFKEKVINMEDKIPVCPQCRGSLRNVNRYGRVVRQVLLVEATKKFVSWSNAKYIPLAQTIQKLQEKLSAQRAEASKHFESRFAITLNLGGDIMHQMRMIKKISGTKRYHELVSTGQDIKTYADSVTIAEQPFRRVWEFVQNKRRRYDTSLETSFQLDTSILQTRQHMLATSILIRCHLAVLSDFLGQVKFSRDSQVKFADNRKDCEQLAEKAAERSQPAIQVEAYVYYGRYCAAEQYVLSQIAAKTGYTEVEEEAKSQAAQRELDNLKQSGLQKIEQAKLICQTHAGSTSHLTKEVDQVSEMIKQSTIHDVILPHEMKAIYEAMSREFGGTGHWYRCENGHLFTIGECGMAMELRACPQCGAPVGGRRHQAAAGVTFAGDLELQMRDMRL